MVDVEAGHELVADVEQAASVGDVEAVPGLLLVVEDLDVVAAVDPARAGREAVALHVTVAPGRGEAVGGVADRDVRARAPLGLELGPVVLEDDPAVVDVVVAEAGAGIDAAVDQRRAEVAHRLLVAVVVREGEGEVGCGLVEQRARDREIAEVAVLPQPAVRDVAADVEAVGELLADGAAAVEGETPDPVRADGGARLVDRDEGRLLGHHVDDAADGAFAEQDRGRAAQHLDAIDVPGVERIGDGARADIEPGAVVELHDRVQAGKAARGVGRAAVARRADGGDAGGVLGDCVGDVVLAALADLLAWDDLDAGRRLQRREVQPAAAAAWRSEVEPGRGGCVWPVAGARAGTDDRQCIERDRPGLRGSRQRVFLSQCRGKPDEGEDGR
ncbi:hypothetical protein OCOJLMKI_1618 [Methylobacterium iners]|uniref:Uncharacterized protein n=1 Tax=Methylobacterium iners TaxID=418707 RepID=A0ABQ4RUA7_9HYPH|nr:hypothetical protein OCOJLMKI_1618 [Methylobacterium iners]